MRRGVFRLPDRDRPDDDLVTDYLIKDRQALAIRPEQPCDQQVLTGR